MMEEISLTQRNSLQENVQEDVQKYVQKDVQEDDSTVPAVGVLHERPLQQNSITQFKNFFWNSKERKLMGRTGKSWVQILFFYFVFYLAICALFSACWCVFYSLIDLNKPYRQLHDSRISPGIAYRPTSPLVEEGDTVLHINSHYKKGGNLHQTNDAFAEQLRTFLKPYQLDTSLHTTCDYRMPNPQNRSEKSCFFDLSNWQKCTQELDPNFGYNSLNPSPCVFLKFNKIYDWEPEYYNPDDLPETMPDNLKNHIRNIESHKLQNLWVTCKGETTEDDNNLQLTYASDNVFPGYCFPFLNTKGYLSPLVGISLENITPDVTVGIECRIWGKNIPYDRKDGKGLVRFQVHVHSKSAAPCLQVLTNFLFVSPLLSLFLTNF